MWFCYKHSLQEFREFILVWWSFFSNVAAEIIAQISASSGLQLISTELVNVLNAISTVTNGGQEEDCHK